MTAEAIKTEMPMNYGDILRDIQTSMNVSPPSDPFPQAASTRQSNNDRQGPAPPPPAPPPPAPVSFEHEPPPLQESDIIVSHQKAMPAPRKRRAPVVVEEYMESEQPPSGASVTFTVPGQDSFIARYKRPLMVVIITFLILYFGTPYLSAIPGISSSILTMSIASAMSIGLSFYVSDTFILSPEVIVKAIP